jgi:hypothetical protein
MLDGCSSQYEAELHFPDSSPLHCSNNLSRRKIVMAQGIYVVKATPDLIAVHKPAGNSKTLSCCCGCCSCCCCDAAAAAVLSNALGVVITCVIRSLPSDWHACAGVPFHSLDNQQGLLAAIRANPPFLPTLPTLPQAATHHQQQQQQQQRLFAVHRLDTGTSGIVCFATSAHVAGLVAKAFR